jgi:hypothetical protein
MVIQSNMTSKAISEVWEDTIGVFKNIMFQLQKRHYKY